MLVFRLTSQPPLPTNFIFSLFLSQNPLFSRRSSNLSQKNDDLGLIHRWIVVKFKQNFRNPFPSILTVVNFDITSKIREIPLAL